MTEQSTQVKENIYHRWAEGLLDLALTQVVVRGSWVRQSHEAHFKVWVVVVVAETKGEFIQFQTGEYEAEEPFSHLSKIVISGEAWSTTRVQMANRVAKLLVRWGVATGGAPAGWASKKPVFVSYSDKASRRGGTISATEPHLLQHLVRLQAALNVENRFQELVHRRLASFINARNHELERALGLEIRGDLRDLDSTVD